MKFLVVATPPSIYHKVTHIRRCVMDSRADTYFSVNNWKLLSKTGQLCDLKVFHNSCKAITNIPLVRAATVVVRDCGTVYILILN